MNVKIEIKGTIADYSSQDTRGGHVLHKLLIEVAGYGNNPPSFYPITAWNDKYNPNQFSGGDLVEVSAYINSREYNGKYYLEAKLASISNAGAEQAVSQAVDVEHPEDGLPF